MKTRIVCTMLLLASAAPRSEVRAAGFISQRPAESKEGAKEVEKEGVKEGGQERGKEGGDARKPEEKGGLSPDKQGDEGSKVTGKDKEPTENARNLAPKPKEQPAKPKTEVEQAQAEHFIQYDKNGDGKLSLAEFRAGYRGSDMGEGPMLFKERDGDKDAFLSAEEFGKINPKKILSKTEQDRIEGRDWKEEREQRARERERKNDRR